MRRITSSHSTKGYTEIITRYHFAYRVNVKHNSVRIYQTQTFIFKGLCNTRNGISHPLSIQYTHYFIFHCLLRVYSYFVFEFRVTFRSTHPFCSRASYYAFVEYFNNLQRILIRVRCIINIYKVSYTSIICDKHAVSRIFDVAFVIGRAFNKLTIIDFYHYFGRRHFLTCIHNAPLTLFRFAQSRAMTSVSTNNIFIVSKRYNNVDVFVGR